MYAYNKTQTFPEKICTQKIHQTSSAILHALYFINIQLTLLFLYTQVCMKRHSCQPLLGVNLSPEFVNLYFPYASQGLFFFFFTGGSSILNSDQHVWRRKEEAMLCKIHMRDFKPHFWSDFLAYCTRPVSVHLAMVCVSCSFDSFSIFSLSFKTTKFHENYVFLYPFSSMAISSQNNYFILFYTSTLYNPYSVLV